MFTTVSKLQDYRMYCPVILYTDRNVSGDPDTPIFRVECCFTHLPDPFYPDTEKVIYSVKFLPQLLCIGADYAYVS